MQATEGGLLTTSGQALPELCMGAVHCCAPQVHLMCQPFAAQQLVAMCPDHAPSPPLPCRHASDVDIVISGLATPSRLTGGFGQADKRFVTKVLDRIAKEVTRGALPRYGGARSMVAKARAGGDAAALLDAHALLRGAS